MSDTRNHTTRDQLAEALFAHRRGDWSDHTYSCQDCTQRFEQQAEERFAGRKPTREELTAFRSEYAAHSHPDWTMRDYCEHVADALLASDAIAAVRAAAVAETTAAIEALAARLLDPTALVTEGPMISRLKAASMVRAALSGGRTALDTTLTQARADGFDQALMQVVSGIRSAKEAHAERGHRAIVAALVGLIGAVPDTPNPYRADTGADQ